MVDAFISFVTIYAPLALAVYVAMDLLKGETE